jgi:uncharacterized protein YjbJ (UPF0337 family)
MSTLKNQIAGVTDKVAGNLKKNVGKAIDNEQMQAEGAARELQGNAELAASRAQENAGGKVDEVAGAVKRRVGEAIDNQQMQVEGAARELKGKARQAINR